MRDYLITQNPSFHKRDFVMNSPKVCNYRRINGKKQSTNVQVIKTFSSQMQHQSTMIKRIPRYCSYKNIHSVQEKIKTREQIQESLNHYARSVVQPEFDRVFPENSLLQDNSTINQQYQQNKIQLFDQSQQQQQQQSSTQNENCLHTYVSSSTRSTKVLYKNEELTQSKLKLKKEDATCQELDEDDNLELLHDLQNEFSGENLNYKSSNCFTLDTLKSNKLNLKQNLLTQSDIEAVGIYERVINIIDYTQCLYSSMIRNYDFSVFELPIRPQTESYFTASIVNIFQSFTKKHRAPYKMVSKQQRTKKGSAHTSRSQSSPQNQCISEELEYNENENKRQIQERISNIDPQSDDISSSNLDNRAQNKGKKSRGSSMRQSKFHNLKKSFMHALILLFQSDILSCLELSENHSYYLQQIINRMRSFSTKTRSGNGQYEYYSHTHYTALLLKLNEYSLPLITSNQSDLQLHYAMYQEDLSSSSGVDRASIKCNFYKSLIFKIIQMSINIVEKQNNLLSNIECETKSVCRFDYILRVKSGIEKLNQGIQVTRF